MTDRCRAHTSAKTADPANFLPLKLTPRDIIYNGWVEVYNHTPRYWCRALRLDAAEYGVDPSNITIILTLT